MSTPDPGAWGIEPGYHDVAGDWHAANPDAVRAVLDALGAGSDAPGPQPPAVEPPGRLPEPVGRMWGWSVQLPTLHSRESSGIGDLRDLASFGRWARAVGASVVLTSPLGATAPTTPQQPSPYSPSSRRFRSLLHLAVDAAPIAPQGLIDRDAVFARKMRALAAAHATDATNPSFGAWKQAAGPALTVFARFCALAEIHGPDYRSWPSPLRRPDGTDVDAAARELATRVDLHAYGQWLLDRQLREAGAEIGLITDLPIGADPGGADAWAFQDTLLPDVSVGAPPDEFNRAGQDWGLPAFDPWRLAAAEFAPWREVIRATLIGAAGMRIDHVAGWFRLYCIPAGGSPRDGVYLRYPYRALLDVLHEEVAAVGAFVVGEDLGTVPDLVREEMRRRGMLSYKVRWFEDGAPSDWPHLSLGSIGTHDLPTIAGVCSGEDEPGLRHRLPHDVEGWDIDGAVRGAYAELGRAGSAIVVASMEDALSVRQRPNVPGTVESSNWSRPLPAPFEELVDDRRVLDVAAVLRSSRPPT